MEVSSRRRTKSPGYRHVRDSRDNDYEFDVNDISRASTPTSTFSSKSDGRKKEREHRHSVEDYKRKIARLKSELDMEKAKNKKVHKEKSSELRDLRESYEIRKRTELEEAEKRLRTVQEEEIKRKEEELKEELRNIKDKEVKQVLKYKEDELKEMRHRHKKEKESAIKLAIDNEKKVIEEKERRLTEEVEKMKKDKAKIEADYKKKCAEESRKEKEFAKLKEEYDAELRRIIGESKKLALGNLEKLKKAEKALSECNEDSEDDLTGIDFSDLLVDLQSQTSSRVVSRSVSTTSELKMEPINLDNLLASPAVTPAPVTPGPDVDPRDPVSPSPFNREPMLKSRSSSAMSEPAREVFNRKLDDKDRQLQRRVSELQTQTQRLERKIALLRTENDTLKRKQDDKKPLEEKIKTLKKRNAELAAIARRLEEKAKHLQQENLKKTREMTGQQQQGQGQHSTEQMKKVFARQRAKDLAEHAKNMLSKDREIEDLRKKCQELADQLSNADFLGPENSEMYEEKEELVTIMKLAAKERLQLERQLAVAKPGPDCKIVDAEKYKELLDTNETLKNEITKLEKVRNETERLEIELTQKKLECERLSSDINTEKSRAKSLEAELEESASKNTHLTVQVSDLQHRLAELEKVNEECSTLRLSLSDAQHECEVAKGEVSALHVKVQNLETVVKNLEFSTEKLKQVERDYHETVLKLQDKQREIDSLQKIQDSAREKYEQAIKSLQDKIRGLESQCHQQALQQEKLTAELTQLRSQAAKRASQTISCEIQTGKSIEFNPSATSSPNNSPRISPANHHLSRKSPATPLSPSKIQPQFIVKTLAPPPQKSTSPSLAKGHNSSDSRTPNHELIQPHHNDISHATPKKPVGPGLATVHRTESTKSGTDTGFVDDDSEVNHSEERSQNQSPDPDKAAFEDPELYEIHKKLKELEAEASDISEGDLSKTGDKGEDSGMESRGDHRVDMKEISEISLGESRLSVLAKKGPIQVYIAKYSYDPYQYSPNENPEAELPLHSGDYVLIYGDMDEDGFFDGELIDGRRGLVPSNFIEKVADEDLPEFHAAMATLGHHDDDSTTVNSMQHDLDFDSSEEMEKQEDIKIEEISRIKPDTSDLEDIEEEDEVQGHEHKLGAVNADAATSSGAPFPKNLQLDRQLASSILVSWRPPDNLSPADIRSYHVFLDGDFKTTVRGSERTKALLENVESRKVHRVSVRCVSSLGQSHDNHCTILVGKEVQHKPFDLRVYDITANSATVSWCPGNSNYHHAVLVDALEVWVLPPGSFSYTLKGLVPAASHKVTVQARKLTGKADDSVKSEQLSATTEFMTAAGGIPEPPINVQVESGPQEGTLLLTWFPVTIETSGFSNGALVTGYMVYADGQPAKEAKGATNDHTVLTSDDFQGFIPKQLTVRTVTKDKKESTDSEVVRLPQNLIQEVTAGAAKVIATEASKKAGLRKSPLHGADPGEEIDAAFQEIPAQQEIRPIGKPVSDVKPAKPPTKSPRRNQNKENTGIIERVKSPPALSSQNKDAEGITHRMKSPVSEGVIRKVKSPVIGSQDKDSTGAFQRVNSQEKDSGGAFKRVSSQDRDTGTGIKRVNSAEKEQSGAGRTEPVGAKDSRRAVPAIEITRESSNEITNSIDVPDSDHEIIKTDSSESVTSSKISSRQNHEQQQKYSASMDKRDGYREKSLGKDISKSPKQNSESCDITESVRKQRGVNSPRESSSPRKVSPRESSSPRKVSPRNAQSPGRSLSPKGHKHKSHESPRDPQSHRKASPREYRDDSGLSRSQSGDRIRSTGARNSPQRSLSAGKSPITSPLQHKDRNANNLSPNVIKPRTSLPKDDFGDGSDADSISGEINPPIDDDRVRLFVALFDYDPETMSPNIDALDEELPFREGQVIKVYGDKDADGFYKGESGGRVGFIPCNMVSEIQVDDPELEEQLLKEVHESSSLPASKMSGSDKYMKPITSNGLQHSPTGLTPTSGELPVRRMIAVYDYDPQELSPNVDAEVELSFKVGDIITIFGEMDDDGFFMGELNNQRGLVPSNFLQVAGTGLSDDEAMESVSVITPAREERDLSENEESLP